MSGLLTLEEVQALAIAHAPQPQVQRRLVSVALGLVLAGPVIAQRTQPQADLSAMDGYAIAGAGPWTRIGEARAGEPFAGELADAECTRISTGAHLPAGADRVLIQENAVIKGDSVALAEGEALPEVGSHVRQRGFDFAEGDTVLDAPGERIGAGQIALLLAAGVSHVDVYAPARVAVLECGDELRVDPAACGPHQIPAVNGAMIEALLAQTGCTVTRSDPVADDRAALVRAFEAHENADIVLISGGASVGDHDHVRAALIDWGASLHAWKAAIKPGKPVMVATRGAQAVLGLPGNPVSSFVTAFLFAVPMVRKAMGMSDCAHPTHAARMGHELAATGARREFLRGRLEAGEVRLAGSQDSSALRALAEANCLIDRPAVADALAAGDAVRVYPLQNGAIAGL